MVILGLVSTAFGYVSILMRLFGLFLGTEVMLNT